MAGSCQKNNASRPITWARTFPDVSSFIAGLARLPDALLYCSVAPHRCVANKRSSSPCVQPNRWLGSAKPLDYHDRGHSGRLLYLHTTARRPGRIINASSELANLCKTAIARCASSGISKFAGRRGAYLAAEAHALGIVVTTLRVRTSDTNMIKSRYDWQSRPPPRDPAPRRSHVCTGGDGSRGHSARAHLLV
jgi:hypothetical protein